VREVRFGRLDGGEYRRRVHCEALTGLREGGAASRTLEQRCL
jgi:hypothetical protein